MPARRHPLPAALTERPFTLELARSLGMERPRGVGVRRIAPRVYSVVEPDFRERVAAQLATLPADVLVDGVTALRLHGIDLGPALPLRFCSPRGVQVRRLGVRVRRLSGSTPPSQDRLLTPEAAFAAAAYDLGLVELVAAGDWLVRVNKATPAGLRDHVEGLRGRHSRTVRRAAELVRERVDSPPESRLRLCLVLAGLPEPLCNIELDDGRVFLAQPDLTYRRERLVLEYEVTTTGPTALSGSRTSTGSGNCVGQVSSSSASPLTRSADLEPWSTTSTVCWWSAATAGRRPRSPPSGVPASSPGQRVAVPGAFRAA